MIVPRPYFLKEDEQLLMESLTQRTTFNGPGAFIVPPLHRARVRKGITLGPTEYLRVRDTLSGDARNVIGPQLYFVGANEEVSEKLKAIALRRNQYVRLLDRRTGVTRVERGEQSVCLGPTEELQDGLQDGINIDEQHAVLVRDIANGQLRLVTAPQVFVPAPAEEVKEVRERIRLEDFQTVIVIDDSGRYRFIRGRDHQRAFFLEPYHELVTFYWSSGIHKDEHKLKVTHIDSRPKFMWYDFEVRTADNVELVIGVTFFWQILDVEAMVRTTNDVTGDVCSHARSMIIQSVSRASLEQFLAAFNDIVREAVIGRADPFYTERGVVVHAVEVRSVACKDPSTQRILQDIIQETTNRLNRLQKQESENEVALRRMSGEIVAEKLRGELLEAQHAHKRLAALLEGEAEAIRVHALLEGLTDQLAPADRLAVFNTLRKQDVIEMLSAGSAQIYFTPADINLSIEARPNGRQ